MRFSFRWLMAVTAYIALLAAAVGTRTLILMDFVWCVTLLAVCYAIVVACVDRGKRRAMAIGFVALSAIHIVVSYLHPESTPATWLYHSAGYIVSSGEVIYKSTGAPSSIPGSFGGPTAFRQASELVPSPRVANAVVTLVAGFVGCLVGLLAYKQVNGATPP